MNVIAIRKVDDRQGFKCKRHMGSYTVNISKASFLYLSLL